MAAKSNYVSVIDSTTHKAIPEVNRKLFFNAPDMNRWIKEQKLEEKYPKPAYYIVKETY